MHMVHFREGGEEASLQHLWEYCRLNSTHLDQLVVYLHSKGSFTNNHENELLRKYLTKGALSPHCTNLPTQSCNVCSTRMSPLPHPHTSGNMWTAQCKYIAQLYEPGHFEEKMEGSPQPNGSHQLFQNMAPMIGRGRYALEHWVYSHPNVKPCDLDSSPKFTWDYENIPEHLSAENMSLQQAPRFPLKTYEKNNIQHWRRQQ